MRKIHVFIISVLVIACVEWAFCVVAAEYDPIVKEAQKRLTELGYDPGQIDGMMGQKTANAIKEFQQDNNLPVTGKLDEKTVLKLHIHDDIEKLETKEPEVVKKSLDVMYATTDNGRRVILSPNGTWKYSELPTPTPTSSEQKRVFQKPATSKKMIESRVPQFRLWIDENKWISQQDPNDSGRIEFTHKKGEVFGGIIAERVGGMGDMIHEIVINNAKNAMPDAKITFEEQRMINDVEMLCLKTEGIINGYPAVIFGYYYSGAEGTLQVITWTGQTLFEEYKQELEDFLNGTEISK